MAERNGIGKRGLFFEIIGIDLDGIEHGRGQGNGGLHLCGPAVRDFRRRGNDLDVFFKGSISGSAVIRLSFDVPRSSGHLIALPGLAINEGRIDAGGWMMIINDAGGILLEEEISGMAAVSDLEVPAGVLSLAVGKPSYIYRRSARKSKAVFDLVTSDPFPVVETIADKVEILSVFRPGGEEITRVSCLIRNSGKQFLRMKLPEQAKVLFIEVEGKESS